MNARAAANALTCEDLRAAARRRLPGFVFDLVDGGAGDEITLRANRAAFDAVCLRPKQAVTPSAFQRETKVFGEIIAAPMLVAPCGSARQLHPQGEIALARAATALGLAYVVPHFGSHSLETVRSSADGLLWYQLYLMSDRVRERRAVERAQSAGYKALVVTVDTPAQGQRERDHRNGFMRLMSGDPIERLKFVPRLLAKPGWFWNYMRDGAKIGFPNMDSPDLPPMNPAELIAATSKVPKPVTWEDLQWLRQFWRGPIVAKGILTAEDARRALSAGVDGIVVSNHGGRQLDGAPASLRALAEVADAVGGCTELYLDSGVRRGADVLKALSLGARAVLVGRPALFGLAAAGEAGARRALSILIDEMERAMLLMGRSSIAEFGADCVDAPAEWRPAARA